MPSLSPGNIFVADPYYFSNLVTDESNRQLVVHRNILLTSRILSCSIGVLLSFLVYYLIIKKSPVHFWPYRKMLILGATIDTVLVWLALINQVRIKITDGVVMFTFQNIFITLFGDQIYCVTILFTAVAPALGCCGMPIEYFYRYQTIIRKVPPSTAELILYFCILFGFAIPLSINSLLMQCSSMDPNPEALDFGPKWYPEVPISFLFVYQIKNPRYIIHQYYGFILQLFYYLFAILFACLTIRELRNRFKSVQMHEKIKSMQAQLARTLMAQTIIPLLGSVIPRFLSLFFFYTNLAQDYGGDVMIIAMNWYPVFSLAAIIYFIVPYRKFCIGKMRNVWKHKIHVSSIVNA